MIAFNKNNIFFTFLLLFCFLHPAQSEISSDTCEQTSSVIKGNEHASFKDENITALIPKELQALYNMNTDYLIPHNFNIGIDETLTFAELYEILMKINHDLDERIQFLEYKDRNDIGAILRKKREAILSLLQKLDGANEESIILYLAQNKPKKTLSLKWPLIISGSALVIIIIAMASYDHVNGIQKPSSQILFKNFEIIKQLIYKKLGYNIKQPSNNQIQNQDNQRNQQENQNENVDEDAGDDHDEIYQEYEEHPDSDASYDESSSSDDDEYYSAETDDEHENNDNQAQNNLAMVVWQPEPQQERPVENTDINTPVENDDDNQPETPAPAATNTGWFSSWKFW